MWNNNVGKKMWDFKRFRARTRSVSICLFSTLSLCSALQSHAQTGLDTETPNIQIQNNGSKFDLKLHKLHVARKAHVVRHQVPETIKPDQKMGTKIYVDTQIIGETYKSPQGYSLDTCKAQDDYLLHPTLKGWIKYSHKGIAKKINLPEHENLTCHPTHK